MQDPGMHDAGFKMQDAGTDPPASCNLYPASGFAYFFGSFTPMPPLMVAGMPPESSFSRPTK